MLDGLGGVGVGRKNGKASRRHDAFTAGGSANSLTVNAVVTKQRASDGEEEDAGFQRHWVSAHGHNDDGRLKNHVFKH